MSRDKETDLRLKQNLKLARLELQACRAMYDYALCKKQFGLSDESNDKLIFNSKERISRLEMITKLGEIIEPIL